MGGLNFIKDFITGGFSRFYEGIPKFKVPDFPEEPPKWIPGFGFGSKKKIWNAFKFGLKLLIGPLSLLMGREIPNLLWLYNPLNTFPLLMKSFFPPGGVKEGAKTSTPPSKSSPSPSTPSKDLDKEAEKKEKEAKRKERLDAMKKKVGDVTGAVTGAVGKAWNWITGGGDDKKGKVIKEALKKKNDGDKSSSKQSTGSTPEIGVEGKPITADALEASKDSTGHSRSTVLEAKLTTANNQGGAKAVIESISTTASYEETGKEVVTVPATTSSSPSDTPTAKKDVLIMTSGGRSDPYEGLYKGS